MSFTVTTELREDRQLGVTIEVSQDQVEKELRKAATKVASEYRIPGFRKGKAPYHIILKQFGLTNLYSEFVEDLGQELFQAALKQEGIEPYAQSALEDIQFDPLTYKLTVPLEPEVTLGDYRSLRLEEAAFVVDDAEVERRLETYREQFAGWQDVDRTSDYGDMMTIDVKSVIVPLEGEEDAEEIVVLDETDWDVTPDQENPMEPAGFDEQLLGMRAGEQKDFVLSWPADSQSVYAGKNARFAVSVKTVQAYEKPELTDDFAKLVGPDFETLEDLKKSIRESIESGEKSRQQNEFLNTVLDTVVDMSTLDYPPVMIDDQIDSMLADTEQRLRQLGIDGLETFLRQTNQTREEYRERLRPEATKIARRNLVISELVKTEKIEVSEDEIGERIKTMVGGDDDSSEEQAQAAAALANLLRQGAGRNMIVSQMLTEKTINRLLSIVRGEEVPTETGEEPAVPVEEAPEE